MRGPSFCKRLNAGAARHTSHEAQVMSGKWKGSRNKPDGGDQEWVSPHHWMLAVLPLALDQVPSGPEVGRVPSGEGGPGEWSGLLRAWGGTHGKLILGIDRPLAHRPGVVEPLHVVGFIKAARQEEAEAPSSTPGCGHRTGPELARAAVTAGCRPDGVLAVTRKARLSSKGDLEGRGGSAFLGTQQPLGYPKS